MDAVAWLNTAFPFVIVGAVIAVTIIIDGAKRRD